MAITDQISQLVTPAVEAQGLFLEEVQLVSPGKHRIVTCIVDGPASLNLDQVTAVSRAISELLDEAAFMGDTPFTLEVTSPGVDRPLTAPRHFVKNHGRLLKVVKSDGATITGRIEESTETSVTLSYLEKKEEKRVDVALADIKRATVEIEFNRKDGDYSHRVLIWDNDWNIKHISEPFSFMDGEIEFCTGLTEYNNNLLITFGFQDNAAYLLKMPIEYFEKYTNIIRCTSGTITKFPHPQIKI